MTEEQLLSLIGDPEKLKDAFDKERPVIDIDKILKQYNPAGHTINDTGLRPDKPIETDQGPSTVKITRIALPIQKKIVGYTVAFLCGNNIKLDATAEEGVQADLLSVIEKTWEDTKLYYRNMQVAELLFSETEVAELWYTEPIKPEDEYWKDTPNDGVSFKLRMKVLANSLGDTMYPIFNDYGDMIAFGRYFITGRDDYKLEHLDVYTETTIYQFQKNTTGWLALPAVANTSGKIQVIYWRVPQTEWNDVQQPIERYEDSVSKHGDTNEYFGSPMIKTQGEIEGFAKKGEQGKILELKDGATAEYMTWDASPESVKLEQENLLSNIFDLSDTPYTPTSQLIKMGAESGFAIKLRFMPAHLKAAKKEQVFGEGIQRRINLIKAFFIKLNPKFEKARNLTIKPVFEYYLPKNTQEELDLLVTAVTSGIMSLQSAVEKNPLVEDAVEELKRIAAEKKAKETDPNTLDDLNNED